MTIHKPVKLIHPKVAESKYVGSEPTWESISPESRSSSVMRACSWYNYFFSNKEAKDFICEWLVRNDRELESKKIAKIADKDITPAYGWFCRMSSVGLPLTEHEMSRINGYIRKLLTDDAEPSKSTEPISVVEKKPNIQDRLREKMSECAAELEGMYDEFILAGTKPSAELKPINVIRAANIVPAMVGDIVSLWEKRKEEILLAQTGKDQYLTEAYSNFGKIQLRNLLKFSEQVITDCQSYLQIKKVERKPRAKKPISKEKLVSKIKYQKEDTTLKLKSVSPTDMVGATEVWLYDTAKRKLVYCVADGHVGTMSVKGGSLIGFDAGKSGMKTLRKPAEQIKGVMGSKPAARKHFDSIMAVQSKFSGRISETMIILRAY